jgi:hypothetical protein
VRFFEGVAQRCHITPHRTTQQGHSLGAQLHTKRATGVMDSSLIDGKWLASVCHRDWIYPHGPWMGLACYWATRSLEAPPQAREAQVQEHSTQSQLALQLWQW